MFSVLPCIPLILFLQECLGNSVFSVCVLPGHVYISLLLCNMSTCQLAALVWPAVCIPVQLRPRLYLLMTTHLNKPELGMN